MKTETAPVIKLSIDHMKQQIVKSIGATDSELGKKIEHEIEKQIINYNYAGEISREIQRSISTIIQEYFKYGEGFTIVKAAIEDSLNNMFK